MAETNNNLKLPSDSTKTPPFSFKSNELHKHNHDVVIQNGVGKSEAETPTQGTKVYTDLVEKCSISTEYEDESTIKKQFVIDTVIDPLLNYGRHFYDAKKGDRYQLRDLTNASAKSTFASEITRKIRDIKKWLLRTSNRGEGEEKNELKTKKATCTNDTSIRDPQASDASLQGNNNHASIRELQACEALLSLKGNKNDAIIRKLHACEALLLLQGNNNDAIIRKLHACEALLLLKGNNNDAIIKDLHACEALLLLQGNNNDAIIKDLQACAVLLLLQGSNSALN
jgi:hypothetical protein